MDLLTRFLVAGLLVCTDAWDPFNLAPTPPMGFANWNGFGCNYNDTTIRRIADALARYED